MLLGTVSKHDEEPFHQFLIHVSPTDHLNMISTALYETNCHNQSNGRVKLIPVAFLHRYFKILERNKYAVYHSRSQLFSF